MTAGEQSGEGNGWGRIDQSQVRLLKGADHCPKGAEVRYKPKVFSGIYVRFTESQTQTITLSMTCNLNISERRKPGSSAYSKYIVFHHS